MIEEGALRPALMQDLGPLSLEWIGGLCIISMKSAPANLFTKATWAAWSRALSIIEGQPPRALLIRSTAALVSAGVDVSVFRDMGEVEAPIFWRAQLELVGRLESLPCVTVFAAHSLTLTAAFELALACDQIVSTAGARFGLVERNIGFVPAMGGVQRLANRIGIGRARTLILNATQLRGSQAQEWGLVDKIFPMDSFQQDALTFAQEFAAGPTVAYAALKAVLGVYRESGVRAADAAIPNVLPAVVRSEDHKLGVRNFLDGLPPEQVRFTGS